LDGHPVAALATTNPSSDRLSDRRAAASGSTVAAGRSDVGVVIFTSVAFRQRVEKARSHELQVVSPV